MALLLDRYYWRHEGIIAKLKRKLNRYNFLHSRCRVDPSIVFPPKFAFRLELDQSSLKNRIVQTGLEVAQPELLFWHAKDGLLSMTLGLKAAIIRICLIDWLID